MAWTMDEVQGDWHRLMSNPKPRHHRKPSSRNAIRSLINTFSCFQDDSFPTFPRPKFVGDSSRKDDFLNDFDAPEKTRKTDFADLSASWDDFSDFPFMQLPAELRECIYQFALTPASGQFIVDIDRDLSPYEGYNPRVAGRWEPRLRYKRSQSDSLASALLRTCKVIYKEALPVLYKNAIFHPIDNEGLLPLFLKQLGDLARNSIRTIRLSTPFSIPMPQSRFHWAVTCAQVVRLGATVQQVQVEYLSSDAGHPCLLTLGSTEDLLKPIGKPLCKMVCVKQLIIPSDMSSEGGKALTQKFQDLMEEGHKIVAEERLRAAKESNCVELELFCREWDVVSDISSLDGSDWEDLKSEYYKYDDGNATDSDFDDST